MLESVQKLVPWVSALPLAPKVAVTAIWLLLSFVFLYLVWVPVTKTPVDQRPSVRQAYDRMERTLKRIKHQPDGQILVDGAAVEPRLAGYYAHYVAIGEFVLRHPNDLKGAYEEIWAHGGGSRVFTSDTQAFEAVVAEFFRQYKDVADGG